MSHPSRVKLGVAVLEMINQLAGLDEPQLQRRWIDWRKYARKIGIIRKFNLRYCMYPVFA